MLEERVGQELLVRSLELAQRPWRTLELSLDGVTAVSVSLPVILI